MLLTDNLGNKFGASQAKRLRECSWINEVDFINAAKQHPKDLLACVKAGVGSEAPDTVVQLVYVQVCRRSTVATRSYAWCQCTPRCPNLNSVSRFSSSSPHS